MGGLKYKVGDRVRIKNFDWYNDNKDDIFGKVWCANGHIPFDKDMCKYCGKVMTISHVRADHYTMVEDLAHYWTDDMIECKVEEGTKPKMVNLDDVCDWIEKHIFDFPWYDNEQDDFSSKDVANALRKAMEG